MIRSLPLFALLACVPPPPFPAAQVCAVEGLPAIYTAEIRDCDCAAWQVRRAVDSLEASGAVPAGLDWTGAEVWISADNADVFDGDRPRAGGYYLPRADRVIVTRNARALAHELLHRHAEVDLQVGNDAEVEHLGWLERGWHAAAARAWVSTPEPVEAGGCEE